jgi:hypothetical protein
LRLQQLRALTFAGRAEALEAEHVLSVGADLPAMLVLRLALAAVGAEMTVLTMMAAGVARRHGR